MKGELLIFKHNSIFFTLWNHSAGVHYNVIFTQKALEELVFSFTLFTSYRHLKFFKIILSSYLFYTCNLKIAIFSLVGNLDLKKTLKFNIMAWVICKNFKV